MKLAEGLSQHPLVSFKDFRKFFLGRIISAIGDKFFTIALAWWVVSYGGENSKLHLGLLMAINVLAVVLFAPWLGALADKLDKKRCMMTADAGRVVFLGLLAYIYQKLFISGALMGAMVLVMAWSPSGLAISCALFIFGLALGFDGTAVQATFQQVVPNEMKGRFFSLASAASFAIIPLAFAFNGLVTQYFSLPLVIAVNGLAIVISAAAFLFIPRVPEIIKESCS